MSAPNQPIGRGKREPATVIAGRIHGVRQRGVRRHAGRPPGALSPLRVIQASKEPRERDTGVAPAENERFGPICCVARYSLTSTARQAFDDSAIVQRFRLDRESPPSYAVSPYAVSFRFAPIRSRSRHDCCPRRSRQSSSRPSRVGSRAADRAGHRSARDRASGGPRRELRAFSRRVLPVAAWRCRVAARRNVASGACLSTKPRAKRVTRASRGARPKSRSRRGCADWRRSRPSCGRRSIRRPSARSRSLRRFPPAPTASRGRRQCRHRAQGPAREGHRRRGDLPSAVRAKSSCSSTIFSVIRRTGARPSSSCASSPSPIRRIRKRISRWRSPRSTAACPKAAPTIPRSRKPTARSRSSPTGSARRCSRPKSSRARSPTRPLRTCRSSSPPIRMHAPRQADSRNSWSSKSAMAKPAPCSSGSGTATAARASSSSALPSFRCR